MVLGPSTRGGVGRFAQLAKSAGNAAKAGQRAATQPSRAQQVGSWAKQGAQTARRSAPAAPRYSAPAPTYSAPAPMQSQDFMGAQQIPEPAPVEPPPPPPPPQLSEEEWQAQDSTFLGEQSALDLQLKQALAQLADSRTGYNKDFGSSLRNLGYGWQDANNNGLPDDDEIQAGSWNKDDLQGAYGQAYQNQTNDFAARGLMDSSLYADAMAEQDRGFSRQFDDMSGARQQYIKQLLGEETGAKDTYGQALSQAKASASARRAAEYGL